MRISDWSSDVCSSDLSVPPEEIRRIGAVMTMVGGKVVYGEEDFADLSPPLPPASPSWAPVGAFASPGMRTASVQPSVQHARSCHDGCASACGIHGHDHRIAWANPIPAQIGRAHVCTPVPNAPLVC